MGDVFDALADEVRRQILRDLRDGPLRVVDLTRRIRDVHPISRPAVSRHLRVLAEAGLVVGDDRGRERHYRLDSGPLDSVTAFVGQLRTRASGTKPPITAAMLDALGTEVHRARRDRRAPPAPGDRSTPHDAREDTA
ncbi:ArsR/SmtB family transcription factor [Gordonia sp. NPDC003429]